MKKSVISTIVVALVVGIGGFFGGIQYSKMKSPFGNKSQNLSAANRQARLERGGAFGGARTGQGGSAFGDIISKDDKSLTIKLRDGGSRIIIYSPETTVEKFVSGVQSDLEIGKSIIVSGKTNTDGSVTAQSIQLRPFGSSTLPR